MEKDRFHKEEPPLVQAEKKQLRDYLKGCRAGSPQVVALCNFIYVGKVLAEWEKAEEGFEQALYLPPQDRCKAEIAMRMAIQERVAVRALMEDNRSKIHDYPECYDKIQDFRKRLIVAYLSSGESDEGEIEKKTLDDLTGIRDYVLYSADISEEQ
ncbi:MAG: hypothetical protein Q7K55_09475 [Candidatus Levybacteria bacterium]|nr:hypothetical protein [Candidatus Levybacteria bacterium]